MAGMDIVCRRSVNLLSLVENSLVVLVQRKSAPGGATPDGITKNEEGQTQQEQQLEARVDQALLMVDFHSQPFEAAVL